MLRAPEPVLLAIADISGYTAYLVGTEIDHAQNVLQDLLETVVANLEPQLTLIEVEGDACFTYAPGGSVSGTQLLDTIDACYFAFRRRLRDITQATSCECNACTRIPSLDLKFVVHFGQAVHQRVFGRNDLVGPDVIAVHRLLKNTVTEHLGPRAYALLTDATARELGLDCPGLGMIELTEAYADIGEQRVFVEDLEERWRTEQDRASFRLAPADAWFTIRVDMPAAPPVVWEYLTNPRRRLEWMTWVIRIDQETTDGRPGVGTVNHCVHGRDAIVEEVLDYRPFETMTIRSMTPAGPVPMTFDYEPSEDGTTLTVLCAMAESVEARQAWPIVERLIEERFGEGLKNLARILSEKQLATDAPVENPEAIAVADRTPT
jgi:uncharacterized protein YndB with AHSA1/START domain